LDASWTANPGEALFHPQDFRVQLSGEMLRSALLSRK
jgi:hypothetical protein